MQNKVIVLGLDGATWNQFDKFIAKGQMENLRKILENGTQGDLNSFFPYSSKPSWISIFTGTNPGKHGVPNYNRNYKQELPSLWKLISDGNLKSIVINEPIAYPPLKINGIMITGGFSTPYKSTNYFYPPNLIDDISGVTENYSPSIDLSHIEKLENGKFVDAYSQYQNFEHKKIKLAFTLFNKYEWDIAFLWLAGPDMMHHCYWDKPDLLLKFYRELDQFLGQIYEFSVIHNANLIVISDHGGGITKKHFFINSWLIENGFAKFEKPKMLRKFLSKRNVSKKPIRRILAKMSLFSVISKLTPRVLKDAIPDEKNEIAFVKGDLEHQGIISKELNEITIRGVDPEKYEKIRNEIIKKLLEIKDDDGTRVVLEAHKGEEIYVGPFSSRAPDIVFLLNEGYLYSHLMKDKFLLSHKEFGGILSGGHRPEGVFVAVGPDIAKGKKLTNPLKLWDVLPNILHMLNLKIPSYVEGKVIKEIYDSSSPLKEKRTEFKKENEKEFLRRRISKRRNLLDSKLRKYIQKGNKNE